MTSPTKFYSIEKTKAIFEINNTTYNESGYTYNQLGWTYGGSDNISGGVPSIGDVIDIKPQGKVGEL